MVYPVGNRFLHHKAKGKVLLPLMRAYRSMSTYAPDPHVISLNLTRACNLACKMCGQHGTRGNYRSDAACSELPYQDIMRFFHGISSRPLVYLWGGEPLLHPRIMDIIRFLKEEDFPVHLNTHGMLLAKRAKELVQAEVDMITVSIDGPEDIHDRIRGVRGAFRRAAEGVNALRQEKRSQSKGKHPLLKAFCTITPDNQEHLERMIDVAEEFDLFHCTFIHPMTVEKEAGDRYARVVAEEFAQEGSCWQGFCTGLKEKMDVDVLKQQKRRIEASKICSMRPALDERQMHAYYETNQYLESKCVVPWTWMSVHHDGSVVVCPDFPDIRCGNIRDASFNKIWNGTTMKKARALLQQKPLPICARCCKVFGF